MKKILFGLFGFWIACLLFPGQLFAKGTLVISSQVRGFECCDSGTPEALRSQLDALKRLDLSATFAVRYDALSDESIKAALSSTQIEKAAFLEITPSLARDAGVVYRGPIERWYKASNAYLVGYAPSDRIRLIDTYMRRFTQVYGMPPHSTVAWMIDAPSLEYLSKKYGIVTHQLTREQWGTDSYTLYGGPVNVPYYPSVKWPMIPAQSKQSASPVLVVRQTITDPLFTYGDAQSSFTSQPNDYLFGKRDFHYFQQLVEGAMSSTIPNGFGILGLETSMGMDFQTEFVHQLEYVSELRKQGNLQLVTLDALPKIYPQDKTIGGVSAYASVHRDLDQQAIWINAVTYRARLINDHQHVKITDLRVYGDGLSDPYAATPSATLNAYWTVPFLFDGSRFRTQPTNTSPKTLGSVLNRLTTPSRDSSDFALIENDFAGRATGLELPRAQTNASLQLSASASHITAQYESQSGPVSIQFSPTTFSVQSANKEDITNTFQDESIDTLAQDHLLELRSTSSGQLRTFEPVLSENFSMPAIASQYPRLFSPESTGGVIDPSRTSAIIVNSHAILGQSPIRIVLRLRDTSGTPTLTATPLRVVVTGLSVETTYHEPESAQGEYYIDMQAQSAGTSTVQLQLDDLTLDLGRVTVSPHCIHSLKACLRHPRYVGQFVVSKFDEIMRRLRSL